MNLNVDSFIATLIYWTKRWTILYEI